MEDARARPGADRAGSKGPELPAGRRLALAHATRRGLMWSSDIREPQWLRTRAYLLLGPVFGALWFGLVAVLYLTGVAAQFLLIGLPYVVGAQFLLRPIGRFERSLSRGLLGVEIPAPLPLNVPSTSARGGRGDTTVRLLRRAGAVFLDGASWRVLAWTLIRLALGPVGFLLVVLEVALPIVAVVAVPNAVGRLVLAGAPGTLWSLDVACPLLALAGLVLTGPVDRLADAVAGVYRRLATWALGPGHREREAAAMARAEAAEEQIRIDQELHDSIGHMLSMIVVQAGAGAHVFDRDPEFARAALRTIEERGRSALGELDRIITSLRPDDTPGDPNTGAIGDMTTGPTGGSGTDDAEDSDNSEPRWERGPRRPLPGASDLPALLDDARSAGISVTGRLRLDDLPPVIGRAVYRIVREALTNAAKHAPGSPVVVEVVATPELVAVSVVNPVSGVGGGCSAGGGRGLVAMRERAALLGGEASCGDDGEGHFAVRVVLPLDGGLPSGAVTRCALDRSCTCLGCQVRHTVSG